MKSRRPVDEGLVVHLHAEVFFEHGLELTDEEARAQAQEMLLAGAIDLESEVDRLNAEDRGPRCESR